MFLKSRTLFVLINNGGTRRLAYTSQPSDSAKIPPPPTPSSVSEAISVPQTPEPLRSGLQASHKKGTGGRSSFSGDIVTIFGATGTMGRNIINRLGKEGAQMIVPYRRTGYEARHLKLASDLGQMLFFPYLLEDEESIRKAVKHSNIVINLIGRDFETWRFKFDDVHVDGARRLARISREMGVQRFIHVSALNCSPDPPEHLIPGGSGFLRSKYFGELAVKEEFPNAVIIRPAEIYGDFPTWWFENWMWWYRRHSVNKINLYQRGENTYKMPLWMGDLTDGFMRIYRDSTLDRRTYEFAGPYAYNIGEVVDWLFRKCNRGESAYYSRRHMSGYFAAHTNLLELFTWITKRRPPWNWDLMERREATNDVLTGLPTLEDLGITNLMIFDIRAPFLLSRYDRLAYMNMERDEFPDPPPLKRYHQIRKSPDEEEPEFDFDHYETAKPAREAGSIRAIVAG